MEILASELQIVSVPEASLLPAIPLSAGIFGSHRYSPLDAMRVSHLPSP